MTKRLLEKSSRHLLKDVRARLKGGLTTWQQSGLAVVQQSVAAKLGRFAHPCCAGTILLGRSV
ncbi:MAG: hypothetical protein WA085_10260 [Sphingobium sp.]|uniref:hypothetical protein n=1 Tax=Sphingobium sp. CECT 9361 TaxID=2845384 RepID=UPI001E4CC821|nr:hypothetical protein [Sphingobium sp. CECT 9361]